MLKSKRLVLETLEDRCVPAASLVNQVTLANGVLNIVATPKQEHTVVVSNPSANVVQLVIDSKSYTFTTPVTTINYFGGDKGDEFRNLTSIAGTLQFGKGGDVVYSTASGQVIHGGEGNNVIQQTAGTGTITVGNGENNIYGGAGDTVITAGKGKNIIYDLLGTNTISIAADNEARDFVFTNAASAVAGVDGNDRLARFFAANRLPGSGTLVLEDGVLYFTANNNGDQYTITQSGKKLIVVYNLNDGAGNRTAIFNKADVKLIANFGGAGDDVFINNTDIADVQYGAGGRNLLVGGFGELNLLKAGGSAGNSVAIGRSPRYNDLNGSGTTSTTAVLIVNPCARTNIVRTNNPDDVIVGFDAGDDIFVSPFELMKKW